MGAWRVTGDVDYELLIACPATADVEGELICLRCYDGTEVSSVGLVLREVSGLETARRVVRAAGNGSPLSHFARYSLAVCRSTRPEETHFVDREPAGWPCGSRRQTAGAA